MCGSSSVEAAVFGSSDVLRVAVFREQQCLGAAVCGSRSMLEQQCLVAAGFARSCAWQNSLGAASSVWEQQYVGVAVCASRSVSEQQYVGAALFGSRSVWEEQCLVEAVWEQPAVCGSSGV